MKKSTHIQDELNQIVGGLLHLPDELPYHVPTDYFKTLPSKIISKVQSQVDDVHEELEQLSPLLASLKSKVTYQTDSSYFENNKSVLADIQTADNARIVPFKRLVSIKKIAIAASIFIAFAGTATFLFLKRNEQHIVHTPVIQTDMDIHQELAQIETDAVIRYLENYALPSDRSVMEDYIDPEALPESNEFFDEATFDKGLLEHNIPEQL